MTNKNYIPSYWQQCAQLTIEDAALFLTGINDPKTHRALIDNSQMAYEHFEATLVETYYANVELITDAIEVGLLRVTKEVFKRGGKLSTESSLEKDSFVAWCEKNQRQDVIAHLTLPKSKPAEPRQLSRENQKARREEIYSDYCHLKASGKKNYAELTAEKFSINKSRVRQICQRVKKDRDAARSTDLASQFLQAAKK